MLYINILFYPLFALLDFAVAHIVATVFVNWWAPAFAGNIPYSDRGVTKQGYKLPGWLAWFDTFDADLDQGVRDGSISGDSTYWNRVGWLYRNRAYGFSYWVLGIEFVPANWRVIRADDDLFLAVANGYFSVHIKNFAGIQWKFGWKAWNDYDRTTQEWPTKPWGPVWRVPFVFSVSRSK